MIISAIIILCTLLRVPDNDSLLDRSSFLTPRDYDLYLLERLGQGECSICTEDEIKMVMSVAINRVNCSRFPDNLHDVLYQDNQFHGMYRVDRDTFGNEIISKKVTRCAEYIIDNGPVIEPNILGFLYPSGIKSSIGKIWYRKVLDSVKYEMQYHHFYSGRPCE